MEDEELDYNSMGVNNKTIDRFKGNTPTPSPIELKPVGDRKYGESVVTTEMVDGRKKTTTTTPWSQRLAGQGKSYKEAGVSKQAAQEYWRNNPDKYQEYLKSKTGMQTGEDVSVKFETPPPPKIPNKPQEPKRNVQSYQYRSGGAGSESVGGSKTLKGAKTAAQKFGNLESTVVDKVYDTKAYGSEAMGKLIQTAEAKKANEIRGGAKENANWKQDLKSNKAMYSQMRKDVKAWRDSGSDPAKMPKSVSDFQKRIDASYERVYTGSSKEKSTSSAAAYKFQKFRN